MNTFKHINKKLNQEFRFATFADAIKKYVDTGRADNNDWQFYDDLDTHIFNDDVKTSYDVMFHSSK